MDYALIGISEKDALLNVSNTRPTRSNSISSSKPSLANDGYATTTWMPVTKENSLWWELDMENFYKVNKVDVDFKKSNNCELIVFVSENKKDWRKVAVRDINNLEYATTSLNIKDKQNARFLKIQFNTIEKVEVREIAVFGIQ